MAGYESPDVREWLSTAHADNQADLQALAAKYPGRVKMVDGRLRVAR